MGIGKIGGFYQSYPIQPIKQVDVETVKAQDALKYTGANINYVA